MFYREGLLAPRPTPKLENHPFSAVHDCLFNLFAATLHKGGRSSIRNLKDAPCRGDREPLHGARTEPQEIHLRNTFPTKYIMLAYTEAQ